MFGVACFCFGNGRICFVATVSLAKLRGAVSQQLSFSAYERCKNQSTELKMKTKETISLQRKRHKQKSNAILLYYN